jgi:hypothetical protein
MKKQTKKHIKPPVLPKGCRSDSDTAEHRNSSDDCLDTAQDSQCDKSSLTLKAFLLSAIQDRELFSALVEGNTTRTIRKLKRMLSLWQRAGCPDLGFVPLGTYDAVDYSLKRLEDVLKKAGNG